MGTLDDDVTWNRICAARNCTTAFFSAYPQIQPWASEEFIGMQIIDLLRKEHSSINMGVMSRAYAIIRCIPKPPEGGWFSPGSGSPRSYIDTGTMPWTGEFYRMTMAKFGSLPRVSDYIREFGIAVTMEAALRNGKYRSGAKSPGPCKKVDIVELFRTMVRDFKPGLSPEKLQRDRQPPLPQSGLYDPKKMRVVSLPISPITDKRPEYKKMLGKR